MTGLYSLFTGVHVSAGTIALLSGLWALSVVKGSRSHVRSGTVYFWSMTAVVCTAIAMTLIRTNIFLFTIAIFSYYNTLTGYLASRHRSMEGRWMDWILVIVFLLNQSFMIYTGNIVLVAFGLLGAVIGVQDVGRFIGWYKPPMKPLWLIEHIGRMIGSYIATVTAVIVVNITIQPYWVFWLLPTVLFAPLIIYHQRKVNRAYASAP